MDVKQLGGNDNEAINRRSICGACGYHAEPVLKRLFLPSYFHFVVSFVDDWDA